MKIKAIYPIPAIAFPELARIPVLIRLDNDTYYWEHNHAEYSAGDEWPDDRPTWSANQLKQHEAAGNLDKALVLRICAFLDGVESGLIQPNGMIIDAEFEEVDLTEPHKCVCEDWRINGCTCGGV
jgi:hypothetical protein